MPLGIGYYMLKCGISAWKADVFSIAGGCACGKTAGRNAHPQIHPNPEDGKLRVFTDADGGVYRFRRFRAVPSTLRLLRRSDLSGRGTPLRDFVSPPLIS